MKEKTRKEGTKQINTGNITVRVGKERVANTCIKYLHLHKASTSDGVQQYDTDIFSELVTKDFRVLVLGQKLRLRRVS